MIDNKFLKQGSLWKTKFELNGYERDSGDSLATQVEIGRCFKVIDNNLYISNINKSTSRIMVSLLEDGYECWLEIQDLIGNLSPINYWVPMLLTREEIMMRIPLIIKWLKNISCQKNKYYWGGTIGPNFDCSGLVQKAFSSHGVWLPRDAYQQENFCEIFQFDFLKPDNLLNGDLIFFGSDDKCDHVAIHLGKGLYMHSSGESNGSNGIGINSLYETDSISTYYRSRFRSVARVVRCFGEASFN